MPTMANRVPSDQVLVVITGTDKDDNEVQLNEVAF
jgi:hypothetical protein